MSCKKKTCKYYKTCIAKTQNDGTGCSDYEYKPLPVLKRKSRYSDDDVETAMKYARNFLSYNDMMFAEVYKFSIPNKEVITHIEALLQIKNKSLFN